MIAAVQELPQTTDPDSCSQDWADLRRVAEGDGDAFAGIVARHQGRLQRLCERLLADPEEARDAVQEVFIKAYRKAATTQARGELYTWLYRVAVNHCLNVLRRRKIVRFLRFQSDADSPVWDVPDGRPDPSRRLEASAEWQILKSRLDQLPSAQRVVLVLARFEGLSYKQIAKQLGITIGAVESRLFRAMRTLSQDQSRAAMAGSGGVEEKE